VLGELPPSRLSGVPRRSVSRSCSTARVVRSRCRRCPSGRRGSVTAAV